MAKGLRMYKEDDDLVFRKACELLEPLNTGGVKLTRETDLTADMEIDSVSVLDIIMEVEDAYDISFPMNRIAEIKTIGELVDAVHELKREQDASNAAS